MLQCPDPNCGQVLLRSQLKDKGNDLVCPLCGATVIYALGREEDEEEELTPAQSKRR